MAITKADIGGSFRRHIERSGYRKTSVEDIARELHISKKTVYTHFESKGDMFRYVVEQLAAEDRHRIATELAERPTCLEKIEGLIGIIFRTTREWWRENRGSEFIERFEIGERAFLDAYTGLIGEWVESGVEGDEFRIAGTAEMTVAFIGGIILAGTRLVQEKPELTPEPEVIAAVRKLLA